MLKYEILHGRHSYLNYMYLCFQALCKFSGYFKHFDKVPMIVP